MAAYTLAMFPLTWISQSWADLPPHSDLVSYAKAVPVDFAYGANYLHVPMSLGHLWSLGCEMQFYILAPLLFLFNGHTEKRRNFVFGFVLLVLLGLGITQPLIGKWKYHFEFAVWPMMLGFCCEYKRHWFQKFPVLLARVIFWTGLIVCTASLIFMPFFPGNKSVIVAAGALLLAPCLLAYLFGWPMPKLIGAPMKWLGERTYSIYLWQQPLTICDYLPDILHPIGALFSTVIGGLWFRFFEWPFLTASRRQAEKQNVSIKNHREKNFLLIGLSIFVVGLLTFWMLRTRYENRLSRQIWPKAAPQTSLVSNAVANAKQTVLLLGDSRMAQWNLPSLSGWTVINAGTGGLTTGQIRLAAPSLLDQFHPDAVVIEAGINDLKFIGLRPKMSLQLVSLAASNLTEIIRKCEQHNCKVIVLETWPAGKPGFARQLIWNSRIQTAVDELNERLRLLNSLENGIRVVDLFARSGLKPEKKFYRDTLHFKPETYERLTPALEKELPHNSPTGSEAN